MEATLAGLLAAVALATEARRGLATAEAAVMVRLMAAGVAAAGARSACGCGACRCAAQAGVACLGRRKATAQAMLLLPQAAEVTRGVRCPRVVRGRCCSCCSWVQDG